MKPWLDHGDVRLYHGDVRSVLAELPAGSAQACITSPPYWGLRDYGTAEWQGGDPECSHLKHDDLASQFAASAGVTGLDGQLAAATAKYAFRGTCGRCGAQRVDRQIGMEETPDQYVQSMVEVFAHVRRVLSDDGTVWLNIGDSFAGSWGAQGHRETPATISRHSIANHPKRASRTGTIRQAGLKPKDLIGVPWMVAFALRADGWYLRQCNIWHKPNAMPESVTDRPGTDHEFVFLLSKSRRYHYDNAAVRQPATYGDHHRQRQHRPSHMPGTPDHTGLRQPRDPADGRNLRSVWRVNTASYPGAHFATFPPEIVTPPLLASTRAGDTVLDPFMGSGTTAWVARHHGRKALGVELNETYLALAAERLQQQSLLSMEALT